jgi:hypothetical protein
MKECPNCGSSGAYAVREVEVTSGRIKAALTHCPSCDYLYLADPSWLDKAYQDEFYGDTGYVARNIDLASKTLELFRVWKLIALRRGTFPAACDIGAGLGMYARMMRDRGYDFYGVDEFAAMPLIKPFFDLDYDFRIKTAFEVVEHLPSLPAFLSEAVGEVDLFFFSTELRGVGLIPDDNWWYYAFGVGQHIGFHSKKSLAIGFSRAGYDVKGLMSYGSSLHALGATKTWRAAFGIAKRIWRLQRVADWPDRLCSRVFRESSLTIPDHLHALKLLG